jgi:hypothetical protein
MNYLQLMNGAGLGDVLIPKKEFIKEHERLVALLNQSDIPALRREAKEQKAELKAELAKKGGSQKSNFIARMMAEAKYKHRSPEEYNEPYDKETKKPGSYVRGSVMNPAEDETTMNRADEFDYNALATKSQSKKGKNKKNPYGASPFIAYHFGNAQSKPSESAVQKVQRKEAKRLLLSKKRDEPKGFISASDEEPRSRPSNITKSEWLRYLDSGRYRELLEQRAFNARKKAQQRMMRFD